MLAAFHVGVSPISFLVDTGSTVSLIPLHLAKSLHCVLSQTQINLRAADNRCIKVHGQTMLNVTNKSFRRSFLFAFIVADVYRPILGTDFLSKFGITVDCAQRVIIDSTTKLCAECFSSPVSNFSSFQISYPSHFPPSVIALFDRFPSLIMPEQVDFSKQPTTQKAKHVIDTGSSRPVFARARQLPPHKYEIAKREFDNMLKAGIVRPSRSNWASPLHMVPKKDGVSWRPCGDYRQLNAITKKDKYPVPHINFFTSRLHGKKIFSKLDIVKAYYHIAMAEEDIEKTAVITPFGLFEFTRMPFGLCNAGQSFQRLMDSLFRDLPFVFIYVDDLIIASTTVEEHESHLVAVFERLHEWKLHIALEKCEFFVSEINFLGYTVSSSGITPTTEKIEALNNFALPTEYAGLRRFIGMIGFYRRFIPNFADIAEPLYQLMSQCENKNTSLEWLEDSRTAFELLKSKLAEATLLHHANPTCTTFHLVTDASNHAIGAALHQCDGEDTKPLAFFSKRLSTAQRSYSTFDRELLAAYLAVVHFKPIIEGRTVVLFTDHKPLVSAYYSQNQAKSDRQQRQLSVISEYVCSIEHICGSENVVADALSRSEQNVSSVELSLPALSDLCESQANDEEIQNYQLSAFPMPNNRSILCDTSLPHPRPFVTHAHRNYVYTHLHNLSHPGVKGSIKLVSERYFWPNMRRDIKQWVMECEECQKSKVHKHNKSAVQHMQFPSSDRFHVVHIDIVGPLTPSRSNFSSFTSEFRYLVTFIDRATRWCEAIPVTNITAETIADTFINNWTARFGVPLHIVTDQGRQFESQLMQHLSSVIGFHRLRTSAYHPQCNGMVERFHRTLKTSLKARKEDWLIALPSVMLALRCIPNEHGICPFTAVTGSSPLMPHSYFSHSSFIHSPQKLHTFVHKLSECMSDIDFRSLSMGIHNTPKRLINNSSLSLNKGDFVFVRVDRVRRPFEAPYQGPFEVIDFSDKIVKIKLENGNIVVVSQDRIKLARLRRSRVASSSATNTTQTSSSPPIQQQQQQLKANRVHFG